ncbi:hypothetical protein GUITHDRAFT_147198 [Guillardia theta CCMP2712]|uniref:Uncharacterized protein n=1 Tax=Guillardia theta (strain CCMP2712) TaxID=905079 RepID=L1IF07_GUITC|nr:hypothetical protein GUITHDRAFT_147198 [Guillardia theta CCMP2712]EKX34504.1 hypothetical protein GUITHDRAFT_147198 [Guillardia theta CCMP2712]|eukprot:XP_005821484.1 hypothetical protein GUITHDRAFT_147198 [Guillardia theta CCMP2712]
MGSGRGCRDSLAGEAGKVDGEREESDEGVQVGDGGALLGGDRYWTIGEDEGAGSWEGLELEDGREHWEVGSDLEILLTEKEGGEEAAMSIVVGQQGDQGDQQQEEVVEEMVETLWCLQVGTAL